MLKDIVCNATVLSQFLTVDQEDSMAELQSQLCAIPADTLQQAEQLFLSQLDFSKFFTVSWGRTLSVRGFSCCCERKNILLFSYRSACKLTWWQNYSATLGGKCIFLCYNNGSHSMSACFFIDEFYLTTGAYYCLPRINYCMHEVNESTDVSCS